MRIPPTARWRTQTIECFLLEPDQVTEAYVGWLNDPEVRQYLESRFVVQDLAGVRAFVAAQLADERTLFLGIRSLELGRHVGNIKIGPIDRHHGLGEVGIMIGDRAAWGRGVGSEAIRVIAQIARHELGLRRLTAGCYRSNRGSARTFEKAGFTIEGARPGHFLLNGRPEDLILMARHLAGPPSMTQRSVPAASPRVLAVVQARMGSTRFPDKVMRPVDGTPMIEVLLRRLSKARRVDRIVLATSADPRNMPLVEHVRRLGFDVFQGSEHDVLDRYYQAARPYRPEIVVRVTGDCPLIDPDVVDHVIAAFEEGGAEYVSNIQPPTYPDGLDTEVFAFAALERAATEATRPFDREHVTPFLRESGLFTTRNVAAADDWSRQRWTVDEPADLAVVTAVFEAFAPRRDFGWTDVLELQQRRPDMFTANLGFQRNEGATMGAGQKLWKRAKRVIPGGGMLLSKRAEMFLPDQWPAYFSKAKGCRVWDLDGREYVDMSLMGIGTNTLGYGHPEVDEAVMQTIGVGNMSTLNFPEEVYLAERLVELHPWAGMARFARSGGEANAIAIRIARAASGKGKVAFCGYHGWHDWYLSANLGDGKNLAGHLLPGLEPNGVPQELRGTVLPFNYNNFAELEALVHAHDVGVIKMEVVRNHGPQDNFLQKVRDLATARGIVLVFDECTSGFRETFGGLYKKYGVEPDMAIFGKTLGNGYAITAVIGKREIMEAAQTTFISSTFWTERIGPSAAMKTLEVMERIKSWEQITAIGSDITARWNALAAKHGLTISSSGLPSLTTFSFNHPNALAFKTLLTQEMLGKGYLAGTGVYACIAHTPDVVSAYFEALDPVFALIRECIDGRDVMSLLKGPICHAGFKRLN